MKTMQSLDKPIVRTALAALMIGGMTIFPGKFSNKLNAAELPVAHLNISVSMQQMLSSPEYKADLKVHKLVAEGKYLDTLAKNNGGLMTKTSTYVLKIGGELVACTINKDSLQAYFGFRNFPAEWRAQQRDRETADLKGAEVPLLIGGSSKYTEAAMYGHEGLIVLYTPHDRPSMKSSAFIFYPFANEKKKWNYGTPVENGPEGKRFIKGKWYDPYAFEQGEGGITMLTQKGGDAYCHFLPRGYFITVVEPINAKATSKTTVGMTGNELTVNVEGAKDLKITVYPVFKGETVQLTDTLNSMNPSDQLAPVISRMPVEAGSELERVLAIEQTASGEPKVVLSGPLDSERMNAYFGTDRFGGREISTVDLGVGPYVALDKNHGKAWVLATVDAVCLVYAQSESDQLMLIPLHLGSLMVSNPDAQLNQQKPVFAASVDGTVISWVEKSGAFKVFYPSSGIQIQTQVDPGMKEAAIGIDRALNRVVLKSSNNAEVRVDVNEAVYKFVGESLKFGPK